MDDPSKRLRPRRAAETCIPTMPSFFSERLRQQARERLSSSSSSGDHNYDSRSMQAKFAHFDGIPSNRRDEERSESTFLRQTRSRPPNPVALPEKRSHSGSESEEIPVTRRSLVKVRRSVIKDGSGATSQVRDVSPVLQIVRSPKAASAVESLSRDKESPKETKKQEDSDSDDDTSAHDLFLSKVLKRSRRSNDSAVAVDRETKSRKESESNNAQYMKDASVVMRERGAGVQDEEIIPLSSKRISKPPQRFMEEHKQSSSSPASHVTSSDGEVEYEDESPEEGYTGHWKQKPKPKTRRPKRFKKLQPASRRPCKAFAMKSHAPLHVTRSLRSNTRNRVDRDDTVRMGDLDKEITKSDDIEQEHSVDIETVDEKELQKEEEKLRDDNRFHCSEADMPNNGRYKLRGRKPHGEPPSKCNGGNSRPESIADEHLRRYPRRNRDPVIHYAENLILAESDISDENPRKKKKAIKNSGSTGDDGYNEFQPQIYFPTAEMSFETVGGCGSIKEELNREMIIPFREMMRAKANKDPFVPGQMKFHLTRGALFWGPPGTGKTLMAKALAYECNRGFERVLPVYTISGSELLTKWVGESEAHLRTIFKEATETEPSIVFIDELDGLVRKRTTNETDHVNFNMVSTLLTLLNGAFDRGTVLVIATTNFKDVIDPALTRSGRFDLKIFFPAPNHYDRLLVIKALAHKWKMDLQEHAINTLSSNTEGFTGADLDLLCRKARNFAGCKNVQETSTEAEASPSDIEVNLRHFFKALLEVEPNSTAPLASSSGFYEDLCERTEPLLKKQLDELIEKLAVTYPVKLPAEILPESSAIWAMFSHHSLMLDYNPVLFIQSYGDPLLLELLTGALLQKLSLKNTLRTLDFKIISNNVAYMEQITTLLQERSVIVCLLNIDAICTEKNGKLSLSEHLSLALERRNKWCSPLLIVSSSVPLDRYDAKFAKLFGNDVLKFNTEKPNEGQISSFFENLFTVESLTIQQTNAASPLDDVEAEKALVTEERLKNNLANLSSALSRSRKTTMDHLLTVYASLSKAVWMDRDEFSKSNFFSRVDAFCKESNHAGSAERGFNVDGRRSLVARGDIATDRSHNYAVRQAQQNYSRPTGNNYERPGSSHRLKSDLFTSSK